MLLLMRELMFSSALMPADQWSTLRVVVMSAKFAVYLNDKHQFDLADETFPEAGRGGLWRKVDSLTSIAGFEGG
jgi:hypothetical protein